MSEHRDGSRRIRQALRLLTEEVRQRVARHPWGHLLEGDNEVLDLRLTLPLSLRDHRLDAASREATTAIVNGLTAVLAHQSVFRPGRMHCLRCQSSDCEHAAPADSREVFVGYGPSGMPRYLDFGQWLLECQDPRVDMLYREETGLVTAVVSGRELARDLLPSYLAKEVDYRLHGQVVAGWYQVPDPWQRSQRLALCIQILSSQTPGSRRRFGLNVVASGPDGETLDSLHERLDRIPWSSSIRWGQSVLRQIEETVAHTAKPRPTLMSRRLEGLLRSVARRLEKDGRARQRRTRHAERRHRSGDRPTRMALADLRRADDASFLFDTRHDTVVVLGERGRAHVFNLQGKLVTSIRYSPAALEKRRGKGLWRPAKEQEIEAVRNPLANPETD